MRNHLIVCGLGHVGYRIAELLSHLGEPFTVITKGIRTEWQEIMKSRALRYVDGDARAESCLRAAGIQTARAILVVTDNDLVNIEIALDAQRIRPDIPIIVRVFDRYLADRVRSQVNVRNVLSPALLT